MRFLRTASTGRLLAAILAALAIAGGGAAIAVAATSGGPVPPARPLAQAVHTALSATPTTGVSAQITFTDNLVDSTDFTGQGTDPLLQGASGRLWAGDGRLRIELQSGDGDAQIVIDHGAFWISDPAQNVVYEGTLPSGTSGASGTTASPDAGHGVPTIPEIEHALTALMRRADVSGAQPGDVAGQAAYRVSVSPKANPGLVGSAQLAWDAVRGVPLQFALYARGDSTPVLALSATSIAYGAVPASDLAVSPPAGARVVQLGRLGADGQARRPASRRPDARRAAEVRGVPATAAHVDFALHAPGSLAGLTRTAVRALGPHAAELSYGTGLGGIAVIETHATPAHGTPTASAPASVGSLSLPTREVAGAKATVLSTALGTVLHFTRGGVAYTVLGSVPSTTALSAARGLF